MSIVVIPQIYAEADLALRIGFNRSAGEQIRGFHAMAWSSEVSRAWDQQVALIKRHLRRNPAWYIWMAAMTATNPTFGGGKVWNPKSWEGYPPFFLDTIPWSRPATRASQQDIRIGRHPHRELPTRQPNIINLFLGRAKQIEITEDYENADSNSLRQLQEKVNIYSADKPYPEFRTPQIKDEKSLAEYKSLFKPQSSILGGMSGDFFYKPVENAAKKTSKEYFRKAMFFKSSDRNYFEDADDPKTGWANESYDEVTSDYQQIPFWIYDIRNDKYVLLPTSIRSFTETITPSWVEEETIGRIDDIPTYVKTVREYSIDLAFSARSPADYLVMWRKIGLLKSFQFPQYNNNAIQTNPPIMRIRLGDIIRRGGSGHQGVAGYFRSFNVTTDESTTIWQTETGELALDHGTEKIGTGPRLVDISFNFKVLHDTSYTEDEDGVVSFVHDAIYKDGHKMIKISKIETELQTANPSKDVIKPLNNSSTALDDADGTPSDTDAAGSFAKTTPTGSPAFAPADFGGLQ